MDKSAQPTTTPASPPGNGAAPSEQLPEMTIREALRKRRMHWAFTPAPVPHALLEQLAWAAGRAPTGGGALLRRIVIVDDPRVVRTIRMVTPSCLNNAPAILLVCTDLEVAQEQSGNMGVHAFSLLDAGASAANVALLAPSLGLGVSFFRCANDAALQAALDLPRTVRPEILIGTGFPAPNPSKPGRVPKRIVYHNFWGNDWNPEDGA